MKALPVIAALAMLGQPVPGSAQSAAAGAAEPETSSQRTLNVIVYGDDSCPQGQEGEIVVCARQPESERYRIPRKLRDKPASPGGQSWTSRVAANEETQRDSLPTGCSVMNNSAVGCLAKALRQWRAERRMAQSENQP